MPAPYTLHPKAVLDIADALNFTFEKYGVHQYDRYEDLIQEALEQLGTFPRIGAPSPALPGCRLLHLRQPGRRARHQFLYSIAADGSIVVLRLLHDSMNVSRDVLPH